MKWNYWRWFFLGLSGQPGILKFVNYWMPFHLLIASIIALNLKVSIQDAASVLVLPLAGVFIGLTFAWSGNAQALMQSDDLVEMFEQHKDGLRNYVYTFQNAVLCLLITITLWGLAGLGILSGNWFQGLYQMFLIKLSLFFFSSLSVRECWHVILGSQFFILAQRDIRKFQKDTEP